MNFITGEKIQNDCDLFIATPDMLNYNPNITINHPKSFNLYNLNSEIDNPKFIYTCSDDLYLFKEKIVFFKNPFVLISHNSDKNIFNNEIYNYIANHNKIIKWYTQNLLFNHPKVFMIPIGIANSQWQHGNLNYISNALNYIENKTNNIYFNFSINTNINKRDECFVKLKDFIEISEKKPPQDYFKYLASFKFGICPEGNGIDSHRIWECYYLKVIPIVIDNIFIRKIKSKYNLPMIILEDWGELRNKRLEYKDYDNSVLDYSVLKNEIWN